MASPLSFYLVAGESSGDQLGSGLMEALRSLAPERPLTFHGVGGPLMERAGLTSLFPMREIALMGFAEILPHILRLKRRIREVVADIEAKRPCVVVTIDSPGFTFRVVRALRARGYTDSRFVHYVAPTVWAYKPERAGKTARLFDALLVLFAFEPPYFTREGLETHWVGHPAAWSIPFAESLPQAPALCLFPGSRAGELKRHLPLYRAVCAGLARTHPHLYAVMPLPEAQHALAERLTRDWPCPLRITRSEERFDALRESRAALCKSGTITLECALAGVPFVLTYRAHPLSAWIVRRMIHIRTVGLPNILLGRAVVPEFLQEAAQPAPLADALSALLNNSHASDAQRSAFRELRALLLPNTTTSPSALAAAQVMRYAARSSAVESS